MVEMSVTDFARNLRNVLDRIEHNGEQIILHRNKHRIAQIIPGSPYLTAHEAMQRPIS
jgi:antitoxin (DNA-binding transcriptional repressor) of toxin-antitoxin stability system